MELNLNGKFAAVTGGSKGIGKAIVTALTNEGVTVIDLSRTCGVDLTTAKGLNDATNMVKDCDILINNVGGGGTWHRKYRREIMQKNYGVMTDLVIAFLSRKKLNWGRVITISSIYGKEKGGNPYFNASKAAQIAYMKCLAGKKKGVTFNTICPGHIDVGKKFPDKPKVIGKPEDVANLVCFLCSDKAKHINGATITVDGGESHSF